MKREMGMEVGTKRSLLTGIPSKRDGLSIIHPSMTSQLPKFTALYGRFWAETCE